MAPDRELGACLVYGVSNLSFPASEGQHVNHCLVLRAMRQAGWRVALVALVRDQATLDVQALRQAVGGLDEVVVIPTRLNYPLLLARHLLPGRSMGLLAATLQRLTSRWPDAVVHLEGIGLVPLVADFAGHGVVVTTTDAWSLRQRRLARRAGRWPLRCFLHGYAALSAWVERRWFPLASAVQVVSPVDAAYLRRQVPGARVHAIPIALPSLPVPAGQAPAANAGQLPTVLFWGDIGVTHIADGLRWLLGQVLPRVTGRAAWVVLGRREPDAALRVLAPGVQFLTWVQDVDALLRAAAVVVLPDADGTGLKNRAVHAMACGVPVVGTPSAFEGFPVTDGHEAMVRGDAQGFAAAVGSLLAQPETAQAMARRGLQFAQQGYSPEAVGRQWAALYAGVAKAGGAPA